MAENPFAIALKNDLEAVRSGLPADLNIQRFVNNAVALLGANSGLQKFARENENGSWQIKAGLMRGAYLGLDALRNEFYLIPYGNKLDFRIDYRGEQKLVEKYSIRPVKEIYAKVVRKGDDFEEVITNGVPSVNFRPLPFNESPVIGAFAVCLFKDGGMIYEVMSLSELNAVEAKSQKSEAWKSFPNEMRKKAVLRRLCKHIKVDFESKEQADIYNADMGMSFDDNPDPKEVAETEGNSEEFIIEGEEDESDS